MGHQTAGITWGTTIAGTEMDVCTEYPTKMPTTGQCRDASLSPSDAQPARTTSLFTLPRRPHPSHAHPARTASPLTCPPCLYHLSPSGV